MLYTILYTSSANEPFVEADLVELAIQSWNWNNSHSVTGCLAYVEGVLNGKTQCQFIQVIEGPENYVKNVFANIKIDTRYKDISIIKEGIIDQRKFSTWKMCVERIKLSNDSALQHFFTMNYERLAENGNTGNNILMDFMKSFYDQKESIACECVTYQQLG
ncbi:MAG: BLUF domain-containing protein [Pedobacter sp.]